jgi:hypothetical protein
MPIIFIIAIRGSVMKVTHFVFAAALLTASVGAHAECVYPKSPDAAPNGSTATEPEMLAGREALMKYQTEVNAYLECLDKEAQARIAEAGDNAEQVKQIKAMAGKKHNAAVEELSARAGEFNQQLRAYKNKGKS